jgi:hypothetical protein
MTRLNFCPSPIRNVFVATVQLFAEHQNVPSYLDSRIGDSGVVFNTISSANVISLSQMSTVRLSNLVIATTDAEIS